MGTAYENGERPGKGRVEDVPALHNVVRHVTFVITSLLASARHPARERISR